VNGFNPFLLIQWHLAGAGDLCHPSPMSATHKFGIHENIQHLFRITISYEPCGDTNDIGIIVFSGQFGQFFSPAYSGTNTLVLVGRDSHAICTSA
jgi:hypothetical protein